MPKFSSISEPATVAQSDLKRIADFPAYFVSSKGKVYSSKRRGKNGGMLEMKLGMNTCGYQSVMLSHKGERRMMSIHRLVAKAFIGSCPLGMECRHLDGNKANNDVTNLAWGTRLENIQDKAKHSTKLSEKPQASALLTQRQIETMKSVYSSGRLSQRELAALCGISQQKVCLILFGKTYLSS